MVKKVLTRCQGKNFSKQITMFTYCMLYYVMGFKTQEFFWMCHSQLFAENSHLPQFKCSLWHFQLLSKTDEIVVLVMWLSGHLKWCNDVQMVRKVWCESPGHCSCHVFLLAANRKLDYNICIYTNISWIGHGGVGLNMSHSSILLEHTIIIIKLAFCLFLFHTIIIVIKSAVMKTQF